jgi:methionyl aminopeptidase
MLTPRESYVNAGRIASDVLKYASEAVVEGMKVEDLCESIEEKIRIKGGQPAFPCNVSQNAEAAHYSASPKDSRTIERGAIVKVDIGVHVDGYIADTAVTVNFNSSLSDMVLANKAILTDALRTIRKDIGVGAVGEVVETEAKRRGYRPIVNLAGHQLDRYVIHAGISIPNDIEKVDAVFRMDAAYAIEPFLVRGSASGWVANGPPGNIYRLISRKRRGDSRINEAVDFIWKNFRSLPFSSRWFVREMGPNSTSLLQELLEKKIVMIYPVLVEASGAPVSQFEHTVYVGENETIITTI